MALKWLLKYIFVLKWFKNGFKMVVKIYLCFKMVFATPNLLHQQFCFLLQKFLKFKNFFAELEKPAEIR